MTGLGKVIEYIRSLDVSFTTEGVKKVSSVTLHVNGRGPMSRVRTEGGYVS